MNKLVKTLPGIILAFVLALPAWYLGRIFPIIGGPVIAIISGIILTTIFPKLTANQEKKAVNVSVGIKFTSKKILQCSIILLGFEMNLQNVMIVGGQSLLVMLFTLTSAFLIAFFIGKVLKISGSTATLIGVGTAICGGSAIAAAAPVIRAKDDDVARAISTIFLFNIIAVFIFPALGQAMHMGDLEFGMWAGTAVNDTSSVVATGTAWSNMAGNDEALKYATIVKLTRTLMIVPTTLVLAIYTARKVKKNDGNDFKFVKVFPWFVILFILASVVYTLFPIPKAVSSTFVLIGKYMITMAMASIGLNTNIKSLFLNGIKPIVLGMSCWFMVAVVSLIMI
ncbi:UPF0324 membrane protein [Spirochaetia bacterium]|nr:UPF0324 membrane protein [Spirochaetia bacterium]